MSVRYGELSSFFLLVCELNTSYCLSGQKEINAGAFYLFAKSIQVQIRLGHLVGLTLPVAMTSNELMRQQHRRTLPSKHVKIERQVEDCYNMPSWENQRLVISCGTGDQERWVSKILRGLPRGECYYCKRCVPSMTHWELFVFSLCSKVVLHIRPSVWVLAISNGSSYQWQSIFCNHFGTL